MSAKAEFEAPELWGIDPEEKWEWTPRAFREVTDPGEWSDKEAKWVRLPKYGAPKPGAPIVSVAPLSEAMALKLQAAKTKYSIARADAAMAVLRGGSAEKAADEAMKAAEAIYTPALMGEVLRSCIKGLSGFKVRNRKGLVPAVFSGDWAKDSVVIRADWQAELFNDIRTETLFEAEGQQESFTSSPDSAAG